MRDALYILGGLILAALTLAIGHVVGGRRKEAALRREISLGTRAAVAELAVKTTAIERMSDERTRTRVAQIRREAQQRIDAGGDESSLADLLQEVDDLWESRR